MMFLNFRAPNSYKLHAYKNWIINTLIIINVSFLYYEVGFFSFCLLQFVCCYLILLFYFVCNIFGLNGSKCFLSSNCTQLKSMCISANDSARVDMRRSSWNRQWFNGCIFYTMIHSFEAIREFMIKLENRPPQKKWIYNNLPRKDRFTQWCQIIWPRATLKLELTATTYYSIVFCIKHNICPPRAKLSNTDHYPL